MLKYLLTFFTGAAIFSHLAKVIHQTPNTNLTKVSPLAILGGLTAAGCYYKFGLELQTIIIFTFLTILTAIAITDKKTMKIPNNLIILLTITSILSIPHFPEISQISRITGFISVSGILLIITLIVPGAFGGGDIKLMAASGIFLGANTCLTAFITAILTAGVYVTYQLATQKKGRKDQIAFGPFLCLGIAIAIFGGEQLQQFIF